MPEINAAAVQSFLDNYYVLETGYWHELLDFYGCSRVRRRGTDRETTVYRRGKKYAEAVSEFVEWQRIMASVLVLCPPDWCPELKGCG